MTATQTERRPWYLKHDKCRGCRHPELVSVLDLGEQPLANAFRAPDDDSPELKYPLHLLRCPSCELLQLSVVVDPAVMYGGGYVYRSGYSAGWANHCHGLAKEIGRDKKVLEIGCLDGVMLRHCRDNGCTILGIDPSAPDTPDSLPIRRELFGRDTKISGPGCWDVVVAQNVFGHVDDAEGFLYGIRHALASDGTAIIECPWSVDLIDGVRWDTIYHEHLSYWGLRPLMRLATAVDLPVFRVQYFPDIHGGTMRYYLGHTSRQVDTTMYRTWQDERMDGSDWHRFSDTAHDQIDYWNTWFRFAEYGRVAAYGASAKFNTFMNALSPRPDLIAVCDDNPTKHGLVTPGWRYPVVAPNAETMSQLDVLLVGAENWQPEIEAKARRLGFSGEVKALWQ